MSSGKEHGWTQYSNPGLQGASLFLLYRNLLPPPMAPGLRSPRWWWWGEVLALLPVVPPCPALCGHPEGHISLSLCSSDLWPQQLFPPPSVLVGSGLRLCWTPGVSSETR